MRLMVPIFTAAVPEKVEIKDQNMQTETVESKDQQVQAETSAQGILSTIGVKTASLAVLMYMMHWIRVIKLQRVWQLFIPE